MPKSLRRRSRLGKYVLDKRLGEGAYGQVWKARDTVQGSDIALKVVFPTLVQEMGEKMVVREARIASSLQHPNVLPILNADFVEGHFVMATPLAQTSLDAYRPATRSPKTALGILRDVAAGLAHAHERGVLHRDVKPHNILVTEDGRGMIADFGFARLAEDATLTQCGTLGYMAPEQAYGKPAKASDVFGWGLVAYELLTGAIPSWPFEWPLTRHAKFAKRTPAAFAPVIQRAITFNPRERYEDGGALLEAIDEAYRATNERRRQEKLPTPQSLLASTFAEFHGARLGMRYACRKCGGALGEAMKSCPWCGAKDHSFREVSGFPLVCPSCERGVRAEWMACGWCGTKLAGNGHPPPPDPRAARRCATGGCGGELRLFMRYCPRCTKKERRSWRAPGLKDRCPRCEGPVHADYFAHCPWCGINL